MSRMISCVIIAGTLFSSSLVGNTLQPTFSDFDKKIYEWSKTMAELFQLVHHKYYLTIDPTKSMVNAMTAFVKALDPHSAFLDAKAYNEILIMTRGERCGIGIFVNATKEVDEEFLLIIDVSPAGPADLASIKAEDKIVEIDGESLRGMTLDEAIAKLSGKRYSTVDIKVQRTGTPELLSFTITRDIIKEPNALCYHLQEHNMYYLGLNMFTENSVKQVEQLLKKIQQQQSRGLILDLRNNSGGLLEAVIDIAGLFLPEGSLVVATKGRDDKEIERYVTTKKPITNSKIPIIILVNNYTASAAEILAGCLQYYSEKSLNNAFVIVIGSVTFGKGSVQEVIPLSNDCAMKLTIALYYLPNNISIQGVGVIPDFEIEQKLPTTKDIQWFNKHFGRESALKNTIKPVNKDTQEPAKKEVAEKDKDKKKEKETSWYEKKKELIGGDYLVLSAVRILEMASMIRTSHAKSITTRKDILQLLKALYTPNDKLTLEEISI